MAQKMNRKCPFPPMPNEAQLLAPRGASGFPGQQAQGGVWVAEGGVGTEPSE